MYITSFFMYFRFCCVLQLFATSFQRSKRNASCLDANGLDSNHARTRSKDGRQSRTKQEKREELHSAYQTSRGRHPTTQAVLQPRSFTSLEQLHPAPFLKEARAGASKVQIQDRPGKIDPYRSSILANLKIQGS